MLLWYESEATNEFIREFYYLAILRTLGAYSTLPPASALVVGCKEGAEAKRRNLSPFQRDETWGIGGICYQEYISRGRAG